MVGGCMLWLSCLLLAGCLGGGEANSWCVDDQPCVTGVNPQQGSLAGGTRITMGGQGFAKKRINLSNDPNIGNQVYLVSDTLKYVCDIHPDGCTETQLTCYTRPMLEDRYYVRVIVDGVEVPVHMHCRHDEGKSYTCSYYVRSGNTPTMTTLEPYWGYPDDIVSITGKIMTDLYGSNVANSTNGEVAKLLRFWMTDSLCDPVKEGTNDELYYLALEEESQKGGISCKPLGSFVGYRNASYIIEGDYGRSQAAIELLRLSSDNTIYMQGTHAAITSISQSEGSVVGGSKVTIAGKFFDDTTKPIEVYVGGEKCEEAELTSKTDTQNSEIVFYTTAQPASAALSGSRGVYFQLWNHTDVMDLDLSEIHDITEEPLTETGLEDFYWEDSESLNRFVTKTEGIFVVPFTNSYRFLLFADDAALLYMSTDGNPANKVNITSTEYSWNVDDAAVSDTMELQQGQQIYLEVLHRERSGKARMRVSIQVDRTTYTARHSGDVNNEIHKIETSSLVMNEVQELSFVSTATAAATREVWSFTLQYDDPTGKKFQIGVLGMKTIAIAVDAGNEAVRSALMNLAFIDYTDLGAAVTDRFDVSYESSKRKYTITFPDHKGSYGSVSVKKSADSPSFAVTVTRDTLGKPSGQYAVFSMNGGMSPSVKPTGVTNSKLSSVFSTMNSVRCPRYLIKPSQSAFLQDYEKTSSKIEESGERTNEITPFCGHHSSMNPSFLYSAGTSRANDESVWNAGIKANKPMFCFAFLGKLTNEMYVRYRYNEEVHGNTFTFDHYLSNVAEVNDHTDWNYRCLNLLKQIQAVRSDASSSNTEILEVVVYNSEADTEANPLYVDMVSLSSGVPKPEGAKTESNEGEQHAEVFNTLVKDERLIPEKWGFELFDVTTKPNTDPSVYSVNMTTVNCISNLDLVQLAHAESVSTSGQTKESTLNKVTFSSTRTQAATPPISGTFDLAFDSLEANGIPSDVEEKDLEGIITDLSADMGEISVTREGDCTGYVWLAEHVTSGGNHPDVQLTGSSLSGNEVEVSVETVQDGGVFWDPIPAAMLRKVHTKPQVELLINGIPSMCETDCSFTWSEDLTPTLTATSAIKGAAGASLTLTGTGLSTTNENNEIIIGGVACAATSSSETSVTCTVGEGPAGNHPISFRVVGKGQARHEPSEFSFEYEFSVSGISPTSGSVIGGTEVVISGTGFSTDSTVSIGGATCAISASTPNEYDTIMCVTAAGSSAGDSVAVLVSNGGVDAGGVSFLYSAPASTIQSCDPVIALVEGGTEATITGTGFRTYESTKVLVGGVEVTIDSYSADSIEVTFPSMPQGVYDLQLFDGVEGYADNGGIQITYPFKVTDVFPDSGSIVGGTDITISGEGFSTETELNEIKFGDTDCEVTSATFSKVICRLGDTTKTHTVTNTGYQTGVGQNYAWEPEQPDVERYDSLDWVWTSPNGESVFDVTQRVNLSSLADFDGGFSSGPAVQAGSWMYRFTDVGHFYYSTGPVNTLGIVSMHAKVVVGEKTDARKTLSFKILDMEATYDTGAASGGGGTSCDGNSLPNGCSDIEDPDNTLFSFAPLTCLTPKINNISPHSVTATTPITISGEGFSTSCDNEVIIERGRYDARCVVSTVTSTKIVCTMDESCNSLPVGIAMSLDVRVANIGYAVHTQMGPKSNREIAMEPKCASVSPSVGSKEGGTLVTITGSEFVHDPANVCDSNRKRRDVGDYMMTGGDTTSASIQIQGCSSLPVIMAGEIQCVTLPGTGIHNFLPTVVNQAGSFSADCPQSSYSYTEDATPTVTAVTPDPVTQANQILTITGSRLGTDTSDVLVTIGDTPCTVTAVSDTTLSCDVGEPASGVQTLTVSRPSMGLARITVPNVRVTGSLSSVSPNLIGLGGGLDLTIQGFGFHGDTTTTTVTIGENACPIKTLTGTSIVCTCPPGDAGSASIAVTTSGEAVTGVSLEYSAAITPEVSDISPAKAASGAVVTVSGSGFGTDTGAVSVSFDGAECAVSAVTDSQVTCTLGDHAGGITMAMVTVSDMGLAVEVTPGDLNFTYAVELDSMSPTTGSIGGQQSVVLTGNGFPSEGAVVEICGNTCQQEGEATPTQLTCLTPAYTGSDATPVSCDVTVTLDNGEAVTSTDTYTYGVSSRVTGVTPKFGGTGGGTSVTISGQNFGSSQPDVSVSIAGSDCAISSFSSSQIVCNTEAHQGSVAAKVEVAIEGSGIAYQESSEFEYIDIWSSSFTWGGGSLPEAGDLVQIPSDMTVRLDTDTPVLKLLLIQGKVVFDRTKDIQLKAEIILIADGGVLEVGTEEEPFPKEQTAIIELYGHVRSKELPLYGTKVLAVREGILDLHGEGPVFPWVELAQTAAVGASQIQTTLSVDDWPVGGEIVIASTGHHMSQAETETRTITAASGTTITLDSPLEYEHLGEELEISSGNFLQARAEVGLLTRNVIVRGSKDASWEEEIEACVEGFDPGEFTTQTCFQGRFGDEVGSDQFGAQIMLHAPNKDEQVVFGRIEHVELAYVGQAFRLGRYAIHFHLCGNMDQSYVRGCTIHQSFNRAVNIHGTHNVLVEHNVVHDIMGGAMFLEDGVETGNVFQYNLVLFVRGSSSLRNDDVTPAGFWVTNANNTHRHNHVAGGTHFGFWYRMTEHPEGPSYDPDICPRKVPLGQFTNNTVHSQGWFGIWFFMVYTPMEGGRCNSTVPQAAIFEWLTSWNNEKGAETVNVGAVQLRNALLANNEVAGFEGKLIHDKLCTPYTSNGGPMLSGSTIVGRLEGLAALNTAWYFAVILPQGRGLLIVSTTFINYDRETCAVFSVATVQGTTALYNGGYCYKVSTATLVNAPNVASFRWLSDGCIVDEDGQLTGTAGATILPYNGFLPADKCSRDEAYSLGDVEGFLCDASLAFLRFSFNQYSPTNLEGKNVSFTTEDGTGLAYFATKGSTHKMSWTVLVMANTRYTMAFVDAEHITNMSFRGVIYDLSESQWVIITHAFLQQADQVSITDDSSRNGSQATLTADDNEYGDWHMVYNSETETYDTSYLVDGAISDAERLANYTEAWPDHYDRPVNFRAMICDTPNCGPSAPANEQPVVTGRPDDFVLWSDASIWTFDDNTAVANKSTGSESDVLPSTTHQVISIASDTWVVLAESPGQDFGEVLIYGTLEIEYALQSASEIAFRCTHLIVYGRLIVGWKDKPMLNNVLIQLLGDRYTPDKVIDNGPNLGAKTIGVFGAVEMHGGEVLSWTRLSRSVLAGDRTLSLQEDVEAAGWKVGDVIGIAPTGFDPTQNEKHVIASVAGSTVGLEDPLTYSHLGETLELSDGRMVSLAGEVALLTRRIQLEGVDYGEMETEGFGGRMIVGKYTEDTEDPLTYQGYARLNGVAFLNMGQEGFTDSYDPRYALVYLETEVNADTKPSQIVGCSFDTSYNTAIGVFGTSNMRIEDNAVFVTVGTSLILTGSEHIVRGNVFIRMIDSGTFNGRREKKIYIQSTVQFNQVSDCVLEGNAVAGSDRVGYRVDGEVCGRKSLWGNNFVHSGLIGVGMYPDQGDGVSPCSMVYGFTAWRNWYFGMYLQTPYSIHIENSVLVENTVSSCTIVYGPSATTHQFADKEAVINNTVYVGSTPWNDCTDKLSKNNPRHEAILTLSDMLKAWGKDYTSKVGASVGTFTSGDNECALMPCSAITAYQTIRGRTRMIDSVMERFGPVCSGQGRDYAITTPKFNDDAIHPMYLTGVRAVNTDDNSKAFIHRANIERINPSDCIDMECDGLKKAIIKDLDGSYFGSVGATVIPESEWAWGGDPRRGLGDYRIPAPLLAAADGTKLDYEDIGKGRGIIRDDTCTYMSTYQGYLCDELDYEMLMLESMDEDTETRRVSPVALQSGPLDKNNPGPECSECFVDLINGPQDHGWCMGYTCQLRLSTFPLMLATSKSKKADQLGERNNIVFSGTTPQHLRLHWLNTEDTQNVVVCIYYSRPWDLQVYTADGGLVTPTNGDIDPVTGELSLTAPLDDADYIPDTDKHFQTGTNYFDRQQQYLCVLLVGGTEPIDIKTREMIFISFGSPAVSVDEFFGPNILNNIANYFGISPDKIKVATAARSDGSRKKREDIIEVSITIANPVRNYTGVEPGDLTLEELEEIAASIVNTYQLGQFEDVLGIEIQGFTVVQPAPDTDSDTWRVFAELELSPTLEPEIPGEMRLAQEPVPIHEGTAFESQPRLKMVDENGDTIQQMGSMSDPWEVTAYLVQEDTAWGQQVTLLGSETVSHSDGSFSFTDLGITHSGRYRLDFVVTYPEEASHFRVSSDSFSVANRELAVGVVYQPESLMEDEDFGVVVEIIDAVTMEKVEDIGWKGHTWGCEVSLFLPDIYPGSLSAPLSTASLDLDTGTANISTLSITKYGRYFLKFDFQSNPNDMDFTSAANMFIDVYPEGYVMPTKEVLHNVIMKFDADYGTVVNDLGMYFAAALYNQLWGEYMDVYFSSFEITEGSILATFDISGSRTALDAMLDSLVMEVKAGYSLDFNGHTVTSTPDLWVDGENRRDQKEGMHTALIVVIALLAICLVSVIVGFVIYKYYKSRAGDDSFKLGKRLPTRNRRGNTSWNDEEDKYLKIDRPASGSSSSAASDEFYTNDEAPIVGQIPPKTTNFDFANIRPTTSYQAPGALPPLGLGIPDTTNPNSRPVSMTHLEFQLANQNEGLPGIDNPNF